MVTGGESGAALLTGGAEVKLSSPSKSNRSLLLEADCAGCLALDEGDVNAALSLIGAALWKSSKSSAQIEQISYSQTLPS
jgi:hypothetical protein